MRKSGNERPGTCAVETGHLDWKEVESRLGNQLALEATRLAKKANVMPTRGELVCQGKRGIDMTGGAAGGNCNRHLIGHNDPFYNPTGGAAGRRAHRHAGDL